MTFNKGKLKENFQELRASRSRAWLVYKSVALALMLGALTLNAAAQSDAKEACLCGTVVDVNGARVPGAEVVIETLGLRMSADDNGEFRFKITIASPVTVEASAAGFGTVRVELSSGQVNTIVLSSGRLSEIVMVSASTLAGSAEALETIAGSVSVLTRDRLESARVFDFGEALRKIPGVQVRDEEGFGLRPNISIRGTNPTRSSKVLLLEDGMPLSYAPYGDNASYYHPPVERFDAIEVQKGSGQIEHGPVTLAGVVNYLTPNPTLTPKLSLRLTGGSRDFLNGNALLTGTFKKIGYVLNVNRKQGEGSRENTRSGLSDVSMKLVREIGSNQVMSFKGTVLSEDSQVTYSGLTEDEFRNNPRGNPFADDRFYGRRYGLSTVHSVVLSPTLTINTSAYLNSFSRDWWRQSSNSSQRPNRIGSDPDCRSMADLRTTCGNEGRLRNYLNFGVAPVLSMTHSIWGMRGDIKSGIRYHYESQDRLQRNGDLPSSRDGVTVESNFRENRAASGFVHNRLIRGDFAVTAGLRFEKIKYRRSNRLNGASGLTELTQLIPGVGFTYNIGSKVTAFAGVHRGFAPPRTEDVITNTGGVVELGSELSWNYEAGARARIHRTLSLEGAFFRNDFSNQIVPASVAGGTGAAFTNGGATLQQGVELGGRFDSAGFVPVKGHVFMQFSYTGLVNAEFTGRRLSSVGGFGHVSVTGNRLPYTSRHSLNVMLGYSYRDLEVFVENNSITKQFSDDLNTVGATANGQRGIIPGQTYWNATANYKVEKLKTTFFVTAKNILDRTYIVDRSRGMLPSSPRMLHAGVHIRF